MLKNHYNVDENENVKSFLKENKEKKNSNYIVLNTENPSYVNIRDIALKTQSTEEKLKTFKRPLPETQTETEEEHIEFLINSGEQLVKTPQGYFDYTQALEIIKEEKPSFLKERLDENPQKQVFALNEDDKLSNAREILVNNKINILPVIDNNIKVIGEVRTFDLLSSNIYDREISKEYFNSERDHKTLLNSPIINFMNENPHTLESSQTISDALELMIKKTLPSIIVCREGKVFSVISYTDIFKKYAKTKQKQDYSVEIIGTKDLFEDQKAMISKFAHKTAEKLSKRTIYNEIKLVFKFHGQESGHVKRGSITANAYSGNKVISAQKEISPGTSDEETNDKQKEDWNIPKLAQEALKTLEETAYKNKESNS